MKTLMQFPNTLIFFILFHYDFQLSVIFNVCELICNYAKCNGAKIGDMDLVLLVHLQFFIFLYVIFNVASLQIVVQMH